MDDELREDLAKLLRRIADEVYKSDERYRVTVLVRPDEADTIQAFLCWENGRVRDRKTSLTVFKKGQAVAGRAWAEPGHVHVLQLLRFKNRADLRTFHVTELGMSEDVARRLSPRMLEVREIMCIGLHLAADDFPIVLSVEATRLPGVVRKQKDEWVLRNEISLLAVIKDFRDMLYLRKLCKVSS